MNPAFSSTKVAAAFAFLLFFLLAAPWLSAKKILPQPRPGYSSEIIRWQRWPWLHKFILTETNDIDIAFVGSSRMLMGVDTPYVQQQLDQQLGRKTVVRSICWTGPGFDSTFFFTRDLLAHRRVKTLVFYDDSLLAGMETPELQMYLPQWFSFAADFAMVTSLPWKDQALCYFAAVLGMPKHLLELVVPNLPNQPGDPFADPTCEYWHSVDPATRLGSMSTRLLCGPQGDINTNYSEFVPATGATPAAVAIYDGATTNSSFVFSGRPLPRVPDYFARQFILLAKSHGCNLVLLHLPYSKETTGLTIPEARNWTRYCNTNVWMLGIPPGQLFAGLTDSNIRLLFGDRIHLNANGQQYFTRLITPALIKIYASSPPN